MLNIRSGDKFLLVTTLFNAVCYLVYFNQRHIIPYGVGIMQRVCVCECVCLAELGIQKVKMSAKVIFNLFSRQPYNLSLSLA